MADEPMNLVLEHLRHIRGRVDRIAEDVSSLNLRMGAMEHHNVAAYSRDVDQNSELDRLKSRVDKIERRLDLVE